MKYFVYGDGNIGKTFKERLKCNITEDVQEADVIVLATNSSFAKDIINNQPDNKKIINFTSFKPFKENLINSLGCSTLSVYLPLIQIIDLFDYISTPINIVTLFPQNALSNKSNNKGKDEIIPIHTLSHRHQEELKNIFFKNFNMSHFITPSSKDIVSNIFLTFDEEVNLFDRLKGCEISTRDYKTWNIISKIDNIMAPIDYALILIQGETK